MTDDLNAPLGQRKKAKRGGALTASALKAIGGVLALALGVFVLWAATVEDPLGGEPVVVVKLDPSAQPGPQHTGSIEIVPSRQDGATASIPAPGSQTVTIIDGSSGRREEVTIPAPAGGSRAGANSTGVTPDPRLIEASRHGAIPKIGADGAKPAEVYAQLAKPVRGKPEAPRIAVIVTGLGGATGSTAEALAKLPAAVTFALTPHGANADQLAVRARKEGHELLLQVPMEPFDNPGNDRGAQTLLTTLDATQNLDRLHWLMSRFQGYVGVANVMGARFTASEASLGPVLRETAKRGLIYVDDGSSPRSLASQMAGANNFPFAKADVVIDAVPTAAEIDRALARLEAEARARGSAVGIAGALPVAIERIGKWAKAAEARGFALVPISAVANRAKSS